MSIFRKWEVDFFARLSFIMVDYYQCTAWKLIITTLCWRYKHGLLVLAFGIDVQTHRQKRFSSNNTIKECWFAFVKITISISCSFNTSPHICAWEVKYFFLQIVLVCGHILLFQKALFYYFPNDTLTMLHTPCIVNALDCLTVRKCSIGGVTINLWCDQFIGIFRWLWLCYLLLMYGVKNLHEITIWSTFWTFLNSFQRPLKARAASFLHFFIISTIWLMASKRHLTAWKSGASMSI